MKKAKFRGQRIDTKDWIYGNLVIIDDNYYISSKESYFWSHITEDNGCSIGEYENIIDEFRKVIPETVGQYIGINDKNNKEIYKGDIVKGEVREFNGKNWVIKKKLLGKIVFQIGAFGIAHKKEIKDNLGDFTFYTFYEVWLETLEIIENIYKNKELLK